MAADFSIRRMLAVDQGGRTMAAAGASIIDVGGESTRPGSQPITDDEQIRRVVPVISSVAQRIDALISVDTTRTAVARAAIDAGAGVINDISAGRDDSQMLPLATERKVPIILMHMRGTPATMQVDLAYRDVTEEVTRFLKDRIEASVHAGIDRRAILIDPPASALAKRRATTLELLRRLVELMNARLSHCCLVPGPSLFIEKITGETLASGRPFGIMRRPLAWAAVTRAWHPACR